MPEEEYLPILNDEFIVIGKDVRSKFHFNPDEKLLHPVIHLHLVNSDNKLFLQLRPLNKTIQPGKWDTAVGGHVCFGESIANTLIRESEEEIGIRPVNPEKIAQYIWETNAERELVHVFLLNSDEIPVTNKDELDGGKFWKISEIKDKLSSGIFTENFIYEFKVLLEKKVFVE